MMALIFSHVVDFGQETSVHADITPFRGFHAGEAKFASHAITTFDWSSPAQIWQNPWVASNPIEIPNGMTRVNIGSVKDSVSSYFVKSISEYQNMQAIRWGISGSYRGMFSAGFQSDQVRRETFGQSEAQYFMESYLTYELYRDSLDANTWSSVFLEAVRNLPSLNESLARDKYFAFFNSFGTHYVSSVSWGGSKFASYSLSQSAVQKGEISESNIELFASLKLQAQLGIKSPEATAAWSKTTQDEWQKFDQQAKTVHSTEIIGGDPSIENHILWLRSVRANPMRISQKLSPYHVAVQRFDPERGADLAVMLQEYFLACQSDKDGNVCSGHGVCLFNELANPKRCICDPGHLGDACGVQDGKIALYPREHTKTKVVLMENEQGVEPTPSQTSLFYVGVVPSEQINPASMQGWKTTKFSIASLEHWFACNNYLVDICWVRVSLELEVMYGGKVPGYNTSYVQVFATSNFVFENRANWRAVSQLRLAQYYPKGNGVGVDLTFDLWATYCRTGRSSCQSSESSQRMIHIGSDGTLRY